MVPIFFIVFLCGFANLEERFEEWRMGIDLVVDFILCFSLFNDPKCQEIIQFSLSRV